MQLDWKTGFEIELMAPRGKNRKDLALAIAQAKGGSVSRIFYPQSEPSKVPGMAVFENLVLGFTATDKEGNLVAKCVDDLTLQKDLNRNAPSLKGWYRLLSDDKRMLQLVDTQCDPDLNMEEVLEPIAKLFETTLHVEEGEVARASDKLNNTVALAAPLPGERERPCELITKPIEKDHFNELNTLLKMAEGLGFTVPAEAAVHIHFDSTPLRDAAVFARLVSIIKTHRLSFRKAVDTNRNCIRLGALPAKLYKKTEHRRFPKLEWEEARETLADTDLSKYCDFNLMNIVHNSLDKPTFEVRILPGSINARRIIIQARFFEAILKWCAAAEAATTVPAKFDAFIALLSLPDDEKEHWLNQMK